MVFRQVETAGPEFAGLGCCLVAVNRHGSLRHWSHRHNGATRNVRSRARAARARSSFARLGPVAFGDTDLDKFLLAPLTGHAEGFNYLLSEQLLHELKIGSSCGSLMYFETEY